MRGSVSAAFVCALSLLPSLPAAAQTPNPAMNAPDQLAWQFFIQVNTSAGGSNALFETWASDTDTFTPNPQFPTTAAPLALHEPVVPALGRLALQRGRQAASGRSRPGRACSRNRGATRSRSTSSSRTICTRSPGCAPRSARPFQFPVGAMEVKANWKLVTDIPAFTDGRVDARRRARTLSCQHRRRRQAICLRRHARHLQGGSELDVGDVRAQIQFRSVRHPRLQGFVRCADHRSVQPNQTPNQGLSRLRQDAGAGGDDRRRQLDPVFANYCLKGSQTDFTDATGLDIRLGNSVTEDGFVNQSSCMTCHGRAAWDKTGNAATTGGGFDDNGAPLGPIQPNWYWNFSAASRRSFRAWPA